MIKEIFFNSSMPRSCSTLIQNILAQNPEIHSTPTDGVLELLYSARSQYANSPEFKAQDFELMRRGWQSFCRAGLYSFYNAITEKPYVVSKSRGWGLYYPFLSNFLETPPKVICMVRDIKEIVASLESIHRKQEAYSTDNMLDHAKMQNTTTAKRVDSFFASQPLGLALERFSEIVRMDYAQNLLFIRAEDLTKFPEREVKRIYDYFEIEYKEGIHDFSNVIQLTKEDDSVYGLTPDLHVVNLEVKELPKKAESVLGKDIASWIDNNPNFEWYNKSFGYGKYKYKSELIPN